MEQASDPTRQVEVNASLRFAVVPEWLIDHPDVTAQAIRLYAVLDRYANANGSCWPNRRSLAERCRCSLDTVDRALAVLVEVGAVHVAHRVDDAGDLTSNLYTLHPAGGGRTDAATSPHGCGDGGRKDAATGGRTGAAGNESHKEREPEEAPQLTLVDVPPPQQRPPKDYPRAFLDAWESYPRKIEKRAAFRAWTARVRAGAKPEALAAAAANYATWVERSGTPPGFVKHGSTFFGPDEPWQDYAERVPPVPSRARPTRARQQLEGIKDRIDRAGGLPSGVGSLPPMRKRP